MLSRRGRAALDTLLPPGAHPRLPGLFEAGFDGFYADFERTSPLALKLGFKAALLAAVWLSPLLAGKIPPLTLYDRPTRERALEAMGNSSLYAFRQAFLVLKAVVCLCYGAHAPVRDAVGYPVQHDDPRSAGLGVRP